MFFIISILFSSGFVNGCFMDKAISTKKTENIFGMKVPPIPVIPPVIHDIKEHVHFLLFTRRSRDCGESLCLDQQSFKKSSFNVNDPVKIMIHGFLGEFRDGWMVSTKDALLLREEANVILVGWTNITQVMSYAWVVGQSTFVALYLGKFLDFLVEQGTPQDRIHLIGHSIGAHIAGVASKASSSGIVGRITGLDAAYPLFIGIPDSYRLDKSDAKFVDCIHTSSGLLGIPEPFCDADFYPNGGTMYQPGCNVLNLLLCSHLRSHEYFLESIDPDKRFTVFTCSKGHFNLLDCTNKGASMGYHGGHKHKGVFYVSTGSSPPFSAVDFSNPVDLSPRIMNNVKGNFPSTWPFNQVKQISKTGSRNV